MKDEYSLLNNVEIDFSQYEIEEVNEFEKKRMMKKFSNSNNKKVFWSKKKIAAVAVALLLVVNIGGYGDRVLAAVNNIKYNIDTWLGINNSVEKYSVQIGETLEGKDTKLTLNEFFTDNSRIIINFNINMETNYIYDNNEKLIPDVYIDGKKLEKVSDYLGFRLEPSVENEEESNVILEVSGEDLPLKDKEDVKLVFSTLAKECGVNESDFTYSFIYDSSSYKKASKVIEVNKNIVIGENELSLGNVTVAPDRVLIAGSSKGFSAWENSDEVNYYYDIVDENNNPLPLKEEIGKGAFFYRNGKDINTLKIVPYTYNKVDTNKTNVGFDSRTKYIIEDKIITINLK